MSSKARTVADEKRRASNLKSQRKWRERKEKYLKDLEETVVELEAQNDQLIRETSHLKAIVASVLQASQVPANLVQAIQSKLAKLRIDVTSVSSPTLPRMTDTVLQNGGKRRTIKSASPESGYGSQSVESPDQAAFDLHAVPALPQVDLTQLLANLPPASNLPGGFPNGINGSVSSNGKRDPMADLMGEPSASPPTLAQFLNTDSLALLSALLPQTNDDGYWKGVDVTLPGQPASPVTAVFGQFEDDKLGQFEDDKLPAYNPDTIDVVDEDLEQWTNFEGLGEEDVDMPATDLKTLDTAQLGSLRVGKEYQQAVQKLRPMGIRLTAGMIRLLFGIDLDSLPCSLLKGKLRLMRIRFHDIYQVIQQREAAGLPEKDELCDAFKSSNCADGSHLNSESMQAVTETVISALSAVKTVQDHNLGGEIAQTALDNLERALSKCPDAHH